MFEYRQIIVRMRQGDSDRALAKAGLIGRPKAKELRQIAQQRGWLDTDQALPADEDLAQVLKQSPRTSVQTVSSVEPYRKIVSQWVENGVQAKTIYRALVRNHQYEGSYSSVYRFVRTLKPVQPDATMHLAFDPAEAVQVDFGTGPKLVDTRTGEEVKTWFFLMTLCWSRHQYAELVLNQKVTTWLDCHRHAFEWFNGVPARIIIDNAKCAITRACIYDPQVQRAYAECAEGYGFKIDACPPRDPQKKGRVESGIKYLKNSFAPLREFRDLSDANRQLHDWLLQEAGNRVHGSTHEKPLSRFALEQPLLTPLPTIPPELASWHQVKVHRDCHVQFEKCLYSVPFKLIGQTLWLKASSGTVRLFREHALVAVHPRQFRPGHRCTTDDHLPPEAIAWKMRDPRWCLQQAESIGSHCLQLVTRLFEDKVLENLRAVQGIVRLKDKYGAARLEAACQRALDYQNPRYRSVKTILEKGLDQHPSPQQAFDDLADSYTGQGRFSRNMQNLLKH
ncbi:IS21 family transposase [Vibrio sp.]|uniref:IS21 family transposase n=1 Tax=Vibrio sp. TaxID=678 RepID=UPI003D10D558